MSDTVRIVLHGRLKQFGGPYEFGVRSVNEAVRALCCMVNGFREEFSQGAYRVMRRIEGKTYPVLKPMLGMNVAAGSEIHFHPVAKGKKGGGIGKAILGVVMLVAAWEFAPEIIAAEAGVAGAMGLGGSAFVGAAIAGSIGAIAKFGAFMLFSGVAQMLAPTRKQMSPYTAANSASYLLNGPMNTTGQGGAVPLVYGRVRTGSVTVSMGYRANEVAVGTAAPAGSPNYNPYNQILGKKVP